MEGLYNYLLATGTILGIFVLYRLIYLLLFVFRPLRCLFLQYLALPVLSDVKWLQVTRFEVLVILLYLCLNAISLSFNSNNLQTMTASMALVNSLPNYLGHYRNPLADFFGISQATYSLIQHWTGGITIIHSSIHIILVYVTFQQDYSTSKLTSGYITAFSFLTMFITTLHFVRGFIKHYIPGYHFLLMLLCLVTLLWHVLPGCNSQDRIFSICAGSLLFLGVIYRLVRLAFLSTKATVESVWRAEDVMQLKLRTSRPVSIVPGAYFYIFLPTASKFNQGYRLSIRYNFLRGYPLAASRSLTEQPIQLRPSELVFLIDTGKLPHFARIKEGQSLLLDGPYCHDLDLEHYDIPILTAEGEGITAVLPLMINLTARKMFDKTNPGKKDQPNAEKEDKTNPEKKDKTNAEKKDKTNPEKKTLFRDRTRRVDLFWWLDKDHQDRWVRNQLKALQSLDPENKFLVVWLFYPGPEQATRTSLFKCNTHWKCFYECAGLGEAEAKHCFREALDAESIAPGRRIVVTSGSPEFVDAQRSYVIQKNADHLDVDFVILEGTKKSPHSLSNTTDVEKHGRKGTSTTNH